MSSGNVKHVYFLLYYTALQCGGFNNFQIIDFSQIL